MINQTVDPVVNVVMYQIKRFHRSRADVLHQINPILYTNNIAFTDLRISSSNKVLYRVS